MPGDRALSRATNDAFAVRTIDSETLVVTGSNHRSTLYGAYELLARFGVRFFAPKFPFYRKDAAELIPKTRTVQTSVLSFYQEASYQFRRKYVEEGWSHTPSTLKQLIDWMAKVRQNVLVYPYDYQNLGLTQYESWRRRILPELKKRGIVIEVGGHGYQSWLPRARYPQYYTSGTNVFDVHNDEAVQAYVDKVVAYLRAHREIRIFDAWPPDGARWPQEAIDRFGSVPNAEAHVVRMLERAVTQRLPGVALERIAYQASLAPPDSEHMYAGSVIVDFSTHGRSYRTPIYDRGSPPNRRLDELLKAWRGSFSGPLTIYEYYRKYAFHSLPVVLTHIIGADIPYEARLGVVGVGTYSEPADWITYELTHLLVAALSWDHSLDPDDYLSEYVSQRYPRASRTMRTYFNFVESAGRTLFSPNSYEVLADVARARLDYLRAREVLDVARRRVAPGSVAAYLIDRLAANADFAIADTEINYYRLLDDAQKEAAAKARTQNLVETHRFDGIILQNVYTVARYEAETNRRNTAYLYRMYRKQWP